MQQAYIGARIPLKNPEQASILQLKAFFAIHQGRKVHNAFINISGALVVDYDTKAGFVARKFINPQGEWLKTEYFQSYSREAERPFGLISTRMTK